MYNEASILSHFDSNLHIEQDQHYPQGRPQDISYHFWLDLEHGYCETAGSMFHLYADDHRWAVVAEKSGYHNSGMRIEIELHYFGNCIEYPIDVYPERKYITNIQRITLIDGDELVRITNKEGDDMEQYELISPDAEYVMIRDKKVPIERNIQKYHDLGIHSRVYDNPKQLVSYVDLLRLYSDTSPNLTLAAEPEIRGHIPGDIRKIMTIDKFHFVSAYAPDHNPSQEEMYQLIAKVLVAKDPTLWKPTLPANNHWSNWESGNL
jgi:hypothetical protein